MSFRKERLLNFKRPEGIRKELLYDDKSPEEIRNLFLEVLHGGVSGFCFSIYEEGQKPGTLISEVQVRRRMQILKRYTNSVRSFSCIEGNELVPIIAKEFGMKTLVGAWLGTDKEKNLQEIMSLIQLARDGYVDYAAVGNEVLYRKDLTEHELLEIISYVKKEIPDIPVGYVDAYYEFAERPAITDACDVIFCNCYPFWEGTAFNDSFEHMQHMYHQAMMAGNGKKVIITETGWPSQGQSLRGAEPSNLNAMKYFINTNLWAIDENIEVFYFSSFDETWKVGPEGDVGAHWGIWDKSEKLKFVDEHIS
ncbi:MAG: glycosyl hydrolase family 17 protein [Lentimicrobium sp.]|uniref:glycoside hydrolase family 17 protein n=1 Tax=Lentimicrobium sp. TaxID=2034841 RepID=UPI0025F61487|nr:glycosyl hydrolase family 17 protein [Lentimicrobium sp.]MCO5258316.1 glycosyl hydrolase family 17 protein [Lentimicrobium sp.]